MKLNERSLALWASSTSPVDKEGHLIKKGEMNKQFQRRWFVLKGNLLFYSAARNDKEPLGVIILEEHSVAMSESKDTRYAFDITFSAPGARVYTLAADSEDHAMAWMRAIAHASFEYLRLMVQELQAKVDQLTEADRRESTHISDRMSMSSMSSHSHSGRMVDSRRGPAANRRSDPMMAAPVTSSLGLTSSRAAPSIAHAQVGGDMTCGNTSAVVSNALAVGHTTTTSLLDDELDGSHSPQDQLLDVVTITMPALPPKSKSGGPQRSSPAAPPRDRPARPTPPTSRSGQKAGAVDDSPDVASGASSARRVSEDILISLSPAPDAVTEADPMPASPNLFDLAAASETPIVSSPPKSAPLAADLSDEQILKQLSFQSMHHQSFLAGSPQLKHGTASSDHSEDLFH